MKTLFGNGKFLCPECGSQLGKPATRSKASKRGAGMRRAFICADCQFEIPAHLAERWGGVSVEDARHEWREVYRDLTKRQDTRVYESEHSY